MDSLKSWGSAHTHAGSLLGQQVTATKRGEGRDFALSFPHVKDLSQVYTVTFDNEGKESGGWRTICVEDTGGNKLCGSATGFDTIGTD